MHTLVSIQHLSHTQDDLSVLMLSPSLLLLSNSWDRAHILNRGLPPAACFQGLTYVKSSGHFLAVQEVVNDETHGLIPYVQEIEIDKNEDTYKVRGMGFCLLLLLMGLSTN